MMARSGMFDRTSEVLDRAVEAAMIRIILCALVCLVVASGEAPGSDFSYSSSEYALYAGGNASLGDRADG